MGRDHQAFIWREFGVHAPLFNELAYDTQEPVLDLHEAVPQWQEQPRIAHEYVRGVISHIWEGMPRLVQCVHSRLVDNRSSG